MIKRFVFLASICGLLFGLFSCQYLQIEVPTESQDDHHTNVSNIPADFVEGFDYIRNRDSYKYHSLFFVEANPLKGFNKSRYFVLFNDEFVKAHAMSSTGDVIYRVIMFEEKPYLVYKHDNQLIIGDQVRDEAMILNDYDHPIFFLLKKIKSTSMTKQGDTYSFTVTYQEMATYHLSILNYIDENMVPEFSPNHDADLSTVTFDVSVTLNHMNPKSFQSISIDYRPYARLKYPTNYDYSNARLTFNFTYEDFTKDATLEMSYIHDDHQNTTIRNEHNLAEIMLGQTMTAHLQYVNDADSFKLVISQSKAYLFEYEGIENVRFYLRSENDSSAQERIYPGMIYLEQGTYYFTVTHFGTEIGVVTFTIKE